MAPEAIVVEPKNWRDLSQALEIGRGDSGDYGTANYGTQRGTSINPLVQLWLVLGIVALLATFMELWDPDGTFFRSQGTSKSGIKAFGINICGPKSTGCGGDFP
jgi:hypothetical protein